jgi:hypothetical protein
LLVVNLQLPDQLAQVAEDGVAGVNQLPAASCQLPVEKQLPAASCQLPVKTSCQ